MDNCSYGKEYPPEVHYLSINRFEVTAITAMVIDDFRMGAGQFCIDVQRNYSLLKKLDNGKVLDLFSFHID